MPGPAGLLVMTERFFVKVDDLSSRLFLSGPYTHRKVALSHTKGVLLVAIFAIQIFLHLSIFVSLATAADKNPLDECISQYEKNPESYETVRCLYLIGRVHHDEGLKKLIALRQKYPESLYLALMHAHLVRIESKEKALRRYVDLAKAFRLRGDHDGESLAVAGIMICYYGQSRPDQIRRQLDRLAAIGSTTTNPVARARTTVMIAAVKKERYWSVGEQFRKLNSFSVQEEEALPWSIRRQLVMHRGHCSAHLGDLKAALENAEQLSNLALLHQDPLSQAQAHRLFARVATSRYSRNPSQSNSDEAEIAFLRSLNAARTAKSRRLEMVAMFGLGSLLVGQPMREKDALSYADDCIAYASVSDLLMRGLCTMLKSQLTGSSNPQLGYELAESALDCLERAGSSKERALGWKNLMQRSWETDQGDVRDAVSRQALEMVEHLRELQSGAGTRRKIFSAWADDYYWLANRYLTQQEHPTEEQIAKAFKLSELGRSRTMRDSMVRGETWTSQDVARLDQIQAFLEREEAVVVFQTSHQRDSRGQDFGGIWVYLVTKDAVRVVNLEADRRHANHLVQSLQSAVDWPSELQAKQIFRSTLWEPIRREIGSTTKSIALVTDAALSLAPWDLIDGEYRFSFFGSATEWLGSRKKAYERRASARGLILVDPINSTETKSLATQPGTARSKVHLRLWHSRREGAAVQRYLGSRMLVLEGATATKEALDMHWDSEARLLHFAAHTVDVRGEISIALASSTTDSSDWLSLSEIEKMNFDRALVVLAGCSTGVGEVLPGDDVMSLARAFLRSDARAVVASLWPVKDDASARFFELLYKHMGHGVELGEAMKIVKSRLRESRAKTIDYAGFVVLGDDRIQFSRPEQRKRFHNEGLAFSLLIGVCMLGWVRRKSFVEPSSGSWPL